MKRYLLAALAVLGVTAAQAEDNLIYVKANAPNSGEPYATEDTAAPTLYAAAAYAKTQEGFSRIKVVGTVQETQASTIAFSNVELFGDSLQIICILLCYRFSEQSTYWRLQHLRDSDQHICIRHR